MKLLILGSVVLLAGCAAAPQPAAVQPAERTYERVQVDGQKTTTFRRTVRGDCFYSSLANLAEAMGRPDAATTVQR